MATTAKPTALDPRDFLAIDALLDDEEKAIRDTVRRFVRERILPDIGEWFEQGILPRELAKELAALGLFGMHLEGYGLPGASSVAYGLTCLELEAGDSGIRSLVSVQGSLAMFAIWRWGSEEQKQRWLPPMHEGDAIGCFGLTEPDAGSDPGSMRTNARRDGSDWVLNGSKMWITNGTIADVAVVWARTEDGAINGFLVEKGMPGFEAPEMKHKLSLRASVTSELVLQRRARAGGEPLPGGVVAARPAVVPERGALRDRLGLGRRRARVLRVGARLLEGAHGLRQADRRLPADAAEARGDGARDQPRARSSRCISAA